MIVIYKLISPSGKCYIGQSNDFEKRLCKYRNKLCKSQIYLHSAINKYGWDNFKVEILYQTSGCFKYTQNILDYLEIKYIQEYNATDRNIGYNIQKGGRGGKHSEETKEKMRKPKSEEAKLNMSKARKGKKPANTKKLLQYDLKGNFIKEWDGSCEAARQLNLSQGNISMVCSGKRNNTLGFIFKWLDITSEETSKCLEDGEK